MTSHQIVAVFRSNDAILGRASEDAQPNLNETPRPSTSASYFSCGHDTTGQELCYVCHQRARRNVYISLAEERRLAEEAENKSVEDFQRQRNVLESHRDQVLVSVPRSLTALVKWQSGVCESD